jgi:hypothetical protein
MNESVDNSFRIKAGTCIVTPEQIILRRRGIRGKVGKLIWGENIFRAIVIYGIISILMLAFGVVLLTEGNYFSGIVLCSIGLAFLLNVYLSRNASATQTIERLSIQSIEMHPPRPPITRGYFTVWFSDNGNKRRRFIMLPGMLSGGKKEYLKALLVMQNARLIQ